jgi:CBS-domain-containing membrane protein
MPEPDPAHGQCPEVSDSDLTEAMKEIQGFLDITPGDLQEIYRHALRLAYARISRPVTAAEVMTRGVHHVRADTPLREVAELMAREGISGVPVLDEAGRVAGVISEKDFLTRMGAPDPAHVMSVIASCLGGKGCLATPIRGRTAADIMAAPAVTVREDTSTAEIADLFRTRGINRVPVLDAAGRLAGIVSRADLLRTAHGPAGGPR